VATDGAMLGPNLEAQRKMLEAVPDCSVIASGGVSRKEDLDDLNNLASEYSNLEGVIIGKALYEKTINLSDCFA
jgi:phosphoribosylformimino-5-aminoimidazole carboxamide ribotide isomerase